MTEWAKKFVPFAVRWGIAVVGILWVISQMTLHDQVLVLSPLTQRPDKAVLVVQAGEDASSYTIRDPYTGETRTVDRSEIINPPDETHIEVELEGQTYRAELLGLRLRGDINRNPAVEGLLIADPRSGDDSTAPGMWIEPSQAPRYRLRVPYPRVQTGLISMVRHASPGLLVAAVAIFPITYVLCSYRWQLLLRALGIHLRMARTFVLNMVGCFYSTFMLGTTGGDVLKAYYASKQTPHRTQAVMSVLIDRIIGLLALIVLGGAMAGVMAVYLYVWNPAPNDPVRWMSARVALGAIAILAALAIGLVCFFHPGLRRVLGLDYLLAHLPAQKQVQHIIETMSRYRQRPWLILLTILLSLPVHVTTVLSAMLAGHAFGLPLSPWYYFVVVPVVVLASAIPISPQGAGVMEFFAVMLTRRQGATVAEAIALTMSIRMVQILWNLTGGFFVLRGGYHAPSEAERREMEEDPAPAGT